jgi:hypothetical protein
MRYHYNHISERHAEESERQSNEVMGWNADDRLIEVADSAAALDIFIDADTKLGMPSARNDEIHHKAGGEDRYGDSYHDDHHSIDLDEASSNLAIHHVKAPSRHQGENAAEPDHGDTSGLR